MRYRLPVAPELMGGTDESMDVFRRSSGRDRATGIQDKPPAGLPDPDEFPSGSAHLLHRPAPDDSAGVDVAEEHMTRSRRGFCPRRIRLVIELESAPRIFRELLHDRRSVPANVDQGEDAVCRKNP